MNVLPAQGSFDTLIHWTDQELEMLNYSSCASSAKRQRAAWDKLHQVRKHRPRKTHICLRVFTVVAACSRGLRRECGCLRGEDSIVELTPRVEHHLLRVEQVFSGRESLFTKCGRQRHDDTVGVALFSRIAFYGQRSML